MYTITNETATTRTYKSTVTDGELTTRLLYTDDGKNKWWAFEDLLTVPFIRKKAAERVTQLYGMGITKEDIDRIVGNLKKLVKSNDLEKYEKTYAQLLEFENIAEQTSDPVKQSLGLCTVYILADDEQVDIWSQQKMIDKMDKWSLDVKAQGFFLNWLTDGMNNYSALYNNLLKTASTINP